MNGISHIPHLETISEFYQTLRIGYPNGESFSIMRLEDQPDTKLKEMPLFRSSFYRIVFLTRGGVDWNLPDHQFSSVRNAFYFSYPGKLESWVTTEKVHGFLLCFTDEFIKRHSKILTVGSEFPFFDYTSLDLLKLDTNCTELITLFDKILIESETQELDKDKMLNILLNQCLIVLRRKYSKQIANTPKTDLNSITIFNNFQTELDTYFVNLASENEAKQPSVSIIAKRLQLNPSYLNTVIKNLTGNTASNYIQKKTLLEAKSYLIHTPLQVSEIAYKLGFTSAPYFNKFFKKNSRYTPMEFKKEYLFL